MNMKIKYLGTAAAEGIPALFCECEICKKARQTKGKNIRSRTQLLINDDLLVDYPADSFYHFNLFNVDFSKIHNLLITHTHSDHFYPKDFENFRYGYSTPINCLPFTIYGSEDVERPISHLLDSKVTQQFSFKKVEPFKIYSIGKYLVTPLPADHGTEHPHIYIISDGVKTILWAHDTDVFNEDVWKYFKDSSIHFDLISLDCNYGVMDARYGSHMNLARNIEVVDRLKTMGLVNDDTKVVVNHFSHNGGHVLYEDLAEIVKPYGFIVSFDGLELDI